MKISKLLKINLLISFIIFIGFVLTVYFSQHTNYRDALNNIEEVSALTADGIYYQLSSTLVKPVNIALTMAQDRLLADHLLQEKTHLDDDSYLEAIKKYLLAYHKKYNFDSVFLISTATGRYYSYKGVDRILSKDNPENIWYYNFLNSSEEYSLNVDNDEVKGAKNAIAVFINCRLTDDSGKTIGVVGLGINTDYFKNIINDYKKKYDVDVFLIDKAGKVQVSNSYTGYENKDWFKTYGVNKVRRNVLDNESSDTNVCFWTDSDAAGNDTWYVVTRYIPQLSWHLIIGHNTSQIIHGIKLQILKSVFILIAIIISVLVVITTLIKNFNKNISKIIEQRQSIFKKATEQLYENIYEWNISKNRVAGANTKEYMASIGAANLSYDEGLRVIAEKQIKKEFRDEYLALFNSRNVIKEFKNGNNQIRYDFMITRKDNFYNWMRIDAHIFYSPDDESIHMFSYRKNIDQEKQKEFLASIDEMTKCYTKKVTERMIDEKITKNSGNRYAFFIFDIDNFKHANDNFGHAFGDLCIRKFAAAIKKNFREQDIVGRIGGDEFVAFIPIPNEKWAEEKASELSKALNFTCVDGDLRWEMSASIGVTLSGPDESSFATLYRRADKALYQTKQNGKNGFFIEGGLQSQF